MSVGKRLSKKRKELKLTQEDLAHKINVSRQSISKWELDEYLPDMHNIIELSKVLDLKVEYIISGKDNDNKTKLDFRDFIVLSIGVVVVIITIILLIFIPDELLESGSTIYFNGFGLLMSISLLLVIIGIILIYIKIRKWK